MHMQTLTRSRELFLHTVSPHWPLMEDSCSAQHRTDPDPGAAETFADIIQSETRRSTSTSRRAEDNLPNSMDLIPDGSAEERSRLKEQRKQQATEHSYALPGSPEALKAKLEAALARVRKLEREKSNAFRREKRAKNNMQALLEELKEKNLINEELKDKLERYSGYY
ncbi:THAP domain-containing protein 6 [Larimichthys crocea]|uniref:Uncharacterized protein n=1 Tax=Larimichthys crocea TaxID=215358 RepID=A0ACD3QBI2_LARCR|nr:THAP domain-containing protein 6 [Larimichthys crocea]